MSFCHVGNKKKNYLVIATLSIQIIYKHYILIYDGLVNHLPHILRNMGGEVKIIEHLPLYFLYSFVLTKFIKIKIIL